MKRRLYTISEWTHPWNELNHWVHNITDPEAKRIMVADLNATRVQPETFATQEFVDELYEEIAKYHENNQDFLSRLRTGLNRMREIYEIEFGVVDIKAPILYEGGSPSVLGEYAQALGKPVESLDDDNPHYEALESLIRTRDMAITFGYDPDPKELEEINRLQKEREAIWAYKIKGEPMLSGALLVVGSAHATNQYGLVDRLRESNIELDIHDVGKKN